MALQVWLPLTKDTRNQGLLTLPAPWGARSRDTGGKLGQYCYSDNAVYHIEEEWLGNEWSLACWVKSSGWSQYNDIILCKNTTSSTAAQFYLSIIGGTQLNIGCNAGSQTLTVNYTFATNTWYHVAATYNGTTLKLYLNGSEIGTKVYTSTQKTGMNNLGIGCRSSNAAGTSATGGASKRMNDVRIYDHCLSPMEVKELAKGLVLHYPLADKFLEGTTNLVTNITSGGQTTWANNILTTSGTNADTYFTLNLSENIVNGTQYTISCDAEDIPQGTCWTFPLGQQGNTALSFQIYNGHNEYTFTANNISWGTKRCFMDDGGSPNSARATGAKCKIYNFQIEKKNHATGFAGYGGTRNANTVYDTSGFCNNGTISGALTVSNDTPKYKVSTHFSSAQIKRDSLEGEIKTLACWVKTTANKSTSQFVVADYNSNMCISFYSGCIIGVFGTTRGTGSKSTLGNSYKENDWNHIVVVKTGDAGERAIYCNGVLLTPTTNDYWNNAAGFLVSGRNTSNTLPMQGYISDVRAYATALSASDVKSLYQNCATIDPDGTIRGQIRS